MGGRFFLEFFFYNLQAGPRSKTQCQEFAFFSFFFMCTGDLPVACIYSCVRMLDPGGSCETPCGC